MRISKWIAWGLCGLAGITLLLCMVISAGRLIEETRLVFIIIMVMIGLSFCFFRMYLTDEEEKNAPAASAESSGKLRAAIAALDKWERSEAPEDREAFLQAGAEALLSLGKVELSPRNKAIAAAGEAIAAHRALMELDEDADITPEALDLQRQADALTERAFRLLRDAL